MSTKWPLTLSPAQLHAGMPTEGRDQVVSAAGHVQEMGAGVVLAKLGTQGSMLIQKGEVLQQDVIKADKVHPSPPTPTLDGCTARGLRILYI